MTMLRMDNVLLVVQDLAAVQAFFVALGMEVEGKATVEGSWADRILALEGVRSDIVMLRAPDGSGKIELSAFHHPPAAGSTDPVAPNALGMRRVMFEVHDVDGVVAHMQGHGGELVGEVVDYEDVYRLCFLRGPEGIIVGLAQALG